MSEHSIHILIGKKIKSIRENQGRTQQDIADLCEFEKSTISRIEAGRTNLTIKSLFKLSRALSVKMVDLIDVENENIIQ